MTRIELTNLSLKVTDQEVMPGVVEPMVTRMQQLTKLEMTIITKRDGETWVGLEYELSVNELGAIY